MLLDKIKTAKILLKGMNYYRDELLAELGSSGEELFEQAVQILVAQVETAQTKEQVETFTNNIEDLVDVIPEKVKAKLIVNVPDQDKTHLGSDERTEEEGQKWEELHKEWLKRKPGMKQGLVTLVPDVKASQTDNPQSLFEWLLAQLARLRGQKNND